MIPRMIREAILKRLEELGWTKYQLWQAVKEDVSRGTVYEYLEGTVDTSGEKIDAMLKALDLDIKPKRK